LHSFDNPPLRALARVPKPATPAVTAPDGYGSVTLTGQTYRRAKVSLQVNGTNVQTTRSNTRGVFQFTFTVGPGSTTVGVSATAHGHRPTATTLTVNRPQPAPTATPQSPPNIPVGDYDYVYEEDAGSITTDKLMLTFKDTRGTGQLQYLIQTRPEPTTPENPFDPNEVQTDYWSVQGHWTAVGSELEFVGEGTHSRTNTADPSLNEQDAITVDLLFPFFRVDQGNLYLTLPVQFGTVVSAKGPARDIILTRID
jgi:hypothetical protein